MSSGTRIRTVVADTSALVSLAVPRALASAAGDLPDPLQVLLTSCDVAIPPTVATELETIAAYNDVHAAAAKNVRAADGHYEVVDPYDHEDAPDERPTLGLDDGETDGVVLANALGVDGFLTDEFAGANFPLVHAALQGPRLVTTPRLVVDYARNGHLSPGDASDLITTIGTHRGWAASPYVATLLAQLDDE